MNEFVPLASETFNDKIYGFVAKDTLRREEKLALLLFAAGRLPEVPECFSTAPAQATSFLRRHRVLGRALKRVQETGTKPDAQALTHAQRANEHVKDLFDKREQILARFVQSFCSGIDVVHMKGQSAYYRSGDPAHIRDSNDMDLCLSQPTVLRERLRQSPGLLEHSTNSRLPAHEFLNISFEDLDFDLHKYIPVWRRTAPDLVAAPSPACHIPYSTSEARITIDDVMLAPQTITVGGQTMASPSVTLAAVISLVSVHRDFIMHCASHTRSRSPLRMSDVLELRDMLDHPAFNASAFAEAVRFYEVYDQLGWFGRLHETFLGDLRLLTTWRALTGETARPETVHRIVAHGFWMPFDQDPERDLVDRPGIQRAAAAIGQVAGRAGIGRDRRAQAEVERCTRGRGDAHVGHEAGEYDVLASGRGKPGLQIGAGKSVRQRLFDDGLACERRQAIDDRAARGLAVEQAAGAALVRDMNDRSAALPGPREQARRGGDRGLRIGQGQRAGAIFVLKVDQHEAGLVELRRIEIGAGEFEQGLGSNHVGQAFQAYRMTRH